VIADIDELCHSFLEPATTNPTDYRRIETVLDVKATERTSIEVAG
jgi:hypothetical protein